jgi:hypothetical protein
MSLRLTRRKIAGKYATPTKKKNQLCFTVIHRQTSMNNTNFQQSMNESCQINHPFLIPEGKDSRSNCSFFYNPKSQNDSSRSMFYGIYWDKETVKKVWNKLKTIKQKVKKKKTNDYNFITNAIKTNQDEFVLNCLKDEKFKKFYRNKDSLFPEDIFLDIMLQKCKFNLLIELVKDPCYAFDYDTIFSLFSKVLSVDLPLDEVVSNTSSIPHTFSEKLLSNPQTSHSLMQDSGNYQKILYNLIKYNLYPRDNIYKIKIIAWYLAAFEHKDTFREFIRKESKSFEYELNQFNNFISNNNIKQYGDSADYFTQTLDYCLKCHLEILAVCLCNSNVKSFQITNVINSAAENECMHFLKFLWEKDPLNDTVSVDVNQRKSNASNFYVENNGSHSNRVIHVFPYQTKSSSSLTMHKKANEINNNNNNNNSNNINNVNNSHNNNNNNNHNTSNINNNIEFKPMFSISTVIRIIVRNGKKNPNAETDANLNQIITWKNIEKDPTFIQSLFEFSCFDQISYVLNRFPQDQIARPEYFRKVITEKESELILFFIKKQNCRAVLSEPAIQELIVRQYISHGDLIYYGAEMLQYIYNNKWKGELTKELCRNILKLLNVKDIINCHSPILTCLLLYEFIQRIKEISLSNLSKCEKTLNKLVDYCKKIQEANPHESYVRYLMKQKDTRKRNAYTIIIEHKLYVLLETAEIGTIVQQMWEGKLSNNGLLIASSLYRFLFDQEQKPNDPFVLFSEFDNQKVYLFQLAVWLDSCSLRFTPITLMSLFLVVIYNMFIFMLNNENQLLNNYTELKGYLRYLLVCYVFLVSAQFINNLNTIVFCLRTKRKVPIDWFQAMDFCLAIFAWLIIYDTKKITNEYDLGDIKENVKSFIWDLSIPFTKEVQVEHTHYTQSIAFIIRALILAINDLLVWLRVCNVMLTSKQMGPVIRTISSMTMILLKYISVIAMFLLLCASIFTVLLTRHSDKFIDIPTSIITLFGGFLNHFHLTAFEDDYLIFGSSMFMVYVCLAGVLIVNLLIALMVNVYDELAPVVDASNRAELLFYYKQNKWDAEYGYSTFLTSPFSLVNFIITPIEMCFVSQRNKKKFNYVVTSIYFFLFYFPFLFIPYMFVSIFFLPFAYIKGIWAVFIYQSKLKILKRKRTFLVIKWICLGFLFLVFIYLRDMVYCFRSVFRNVQGKMSDFSRKRQNITHQDVVIFLKFIHSKQNTNVKKDIHSFFMEYLDYETNEKLKMNEMLKKKSEYLKKLSVAMKHQKTKKSEILNTKMYLYSEGESGASVSKLYTKFIKKNLIIIEILENFLYDGDDDNDVVDIDKMRKLLPRTMNIETHHLRRLVFSNVHVLNQAMTKFKISTNAFLQYQLMNKITSKAQKFDKDIDSEIFKIKGLKCPERKGASNNNNENKKEFMNHVMLLEKLKKIKHRLMSFGA